jgi:HEAT repeat protein
MKEASVKSLDNILELEKSYQEQLAKVGKPEYDHVLTLLLQKELDRARRKAASPEYDYPVSLKKYKRVLVG